MVASTAIATGDAEPEHLMTGFGCSGDSGHVGPCTVHSGRSDGWHQCCGRRVARSGGRLGADGGDRIVGRESGRRDVGEHGHIGELGTQACKTLLVGTGPGWSSATTVNGRWSPSPKPTAMNS
jgi:hypothetical protein